MRAAYKSKDKQRLQVYRACEQEYNRRYSEHQSRICKDISVQLTAAVLYTLNVCEDFETEDIQRVFREINGTFEDMSGVGFAGKFDGDDLIELCKERFGIDLNAEITAEFETKRSGRGGD